jgi:4-phytase / acid phosphatase
MLTAQFRALTRLLCLVLLASAGFAAAPAPAKDPDLTVERVVLYMRHGVRSPTHDPPAAPEVTASPWPKWSVPPGFLTEHGAEGVRLLGAYDRQWLVRAGLLPAKGCPDPARVWLHSDSDQRTIATGDLWLASIAPGCALGNEHAAQGEPDALFRHFGEVDADTANAAVTAVLGPAGIEGLEASRHEALATLNHILCGDKTTDCGLSHEPTALAPAKAGRGPRLTGALADASTLSQDLVLEYAEGLPLPEVGWGRATAKDIQAVGVFHSTQYLVLGRPPYLAARYVGPIAQRILKALSNPDPAAPSITALIGHDSGVASLGGLLGLHWQVPGYAADDPPPGGALIYERLRDAKGQLFVRVLFRAQSLEQLRTLALLTTYLPSPYFEPLSIEGCGTVCPLAKFEELLGAPLAP